MEILRWTRALWSIFSKTVRFWPVNSSFKVLITSQNANVLLNGEPEGSGPSEHIHNAYKNYYKQKIHKEYLITESFKKPIKKL